MDKTEIIIETCGVGMARVDSLFQRINNAGFTGWVDKNFNIIKIVPTIREMCSPLGIIYGEWEKDLLDIVISPKDVGKSIFQLLREKKKRS